MLRAGIIVNSAREQEDDDISPKRKEKKVAKPKGIDTFSIAKLEKMLAKSIEVEDYERASEIRDELNKRKRK